ncbi:MAG: 5'/3'-nucleotidase SurE [Microcoleaceae cyanobacterium]
MIFVLTNDDGIDAPGIQALAEIVDTEIVDAESLIIAPRDELSGCGHQVTTQQPIQVQKRSDQHYAIAGTPADCTRIAIHHLCTKVNWVLSGINSGGNLGIDVYLSGTVAAVREAAFYGVPGIAISQYRAGGKPVNWEQAKGLTAKVLATVLNHSLEPGAFWNVNLPYLAANAPEPDLVFCPPSTQPLPVEYRIEQDQLHYVGNYSQRQRQSGTDVDVCFSGNIAITQIKL